MNRLALEAVVVGGALAIAMAAVAALAPAALQGTRPAALTGLVLGAGFHLAFEAAGLNAAYCATGHACSAKFL